MFMCQRMLREESTAIEASIVSALCHVGFDESLSGKERHAKVFETSGRELPDSVENLRVGMHRSRIRTAMPAIVSIEVFQAKDMSVL